jgi:hypothetical protein
MEQKPIQFSLSVAIIGMVAASVLLFLTIQFPNSIMVLVDATVVGCSSYRLQTALDRHKAAPAVLLKYVLVLVCIICFTAGIFGAGLHLWALFWSLIF